MEDLSSIDVGEKVLEFKENLFKTKKYWIIYLVLLAVACLTLFNGNNFASPVKELIVVVIVAIFGIFSITFFSYNNDKDLYKTAFVIILLFGLLCCFLNPVCNVSDEIEHFARADITSNGVLMPEYVNNSFEVSSYVPDFFDPNRALTVFDIQDDTAKIDNHHSTYASAFQQNPFFGYLPQAIGMLFAKILNLNVIWLLWLGRICNLLFYATVAAYAIKKTPILKVPLLVVACIPLCLQQAASFSIDAMFISVGLYIIAYFFYLFKSPDNSIGIADIGKFSILCLIVGLCKLPFLALILLLFCIPSSKFENSRSKLYIAFAVVILAAIGLVWSQSVALPSYGHSWRAHYYVEHNVNSSNQMSYILSHPGDFIVSALHIPNTLFIYSILGELSTVYSVIPDAAKVYDSGFISAIIPLFMGVVFLFYPKTENITVRERIGPLAVLIIIYFGTCLSQMISWGSVGHLNDMVVHARYFLPLFALVPFIFGINVVDKKNFEVDAYIVCLTVVFAAAFVIKLAALYY